MDSSRTVVLCAASAVMGAVAVSMYRGKREKHREASLPPPSSGHEQKHEERQPPPRVPVPTVRVGVSAFLVDPVTGSILVGVRKGSHGAGSWHTPGGHLELNESWEQCYVRELQEETGVLVDPRAVRWCGVTNDIMREGKHYITIHMYAEWDQRQVPRLLEPDKCDGWHWKSWEDIRIARPLFQPLLNFDTSPNCQVPQGSGLVRLRRHIKGKVLFLLGYPGSGKGTQGKILAPQLEMVHVSTGELYRAEAKTGSALGLKMAEYMKEGKIIPKEYTFEYLKQELSKPKYDDGFMLDGYPKDLECLTYILATLKELGKQPLGALWFAVSKDDVEGRLLGRLFCGKCEVSYHRAIPGLQPKQEGKCDRCQGPILSRDDDTQSTIRTRLNNFDTNTQAVADAFQQQGLLHKIDASLTVEGVNRSILQMLTRLACPPLASYFLTPPKGAELSSKWHNHMDACNDLLLRELVGQVQERVPAAQMKIYPISYLRLCAQTKSAVFARVYRNLPNFHTIAKAQHEAFSTGKMGNKLDYAMTRATLEVCYRHPGQGVMTEIEEDLFEAEVGGDGAIKAVRDDGDSTSSIDWKELPGWQEKMIKQLPRYELHHGVDVMKEKNDIDSPPIALDALEAECSGCEFGGLFIFTKEDRWSYRSNEFSNDDYAVCKERLVKQAKTLREVINRMLPTKYGPAKSSCSLEKVHAIWQI